MAVGWKGGATLCTGGCNEDRRLSGIWRALLVYDDGVAALGVVGVVLMIAVQ
jgi:hypothetical protein